MRNVAVILLILFLSGMIWAQPGDLRPRAAGEMRIALPDTNRQLNLYQFAGNSAWLQMNNRGNWLRIDFGNQTARGNLRRYWDAFGVFDNAVSFSGQKHVSPTQTFFGQIRYNLDYKERVNRAIEMEPYDPDPFVLSDSTEGDFLYAGPQVFVAYSHHLWPRLWWGVSLDYRIYRGLKKNYSMPELIRRAIESDFSLAFQWSENIVLGFSFRPYDVNDIINIVQQPDGVNPVVLRYRGEFTFRAVTSKDDRTANSRGYRVAPQVMFRNSRLKGVLTAGYYYRWHEVYDNNILHHYDGYYQGEQYFLRTAWRYSFSQQKRSTVALGYGFNYLTDWAQEPVKRLMFYKSFRHRHRFTVGFSRAFSRWPLVGATELSYDYLLPDKRDYLAHRFRRQAITDLSFGAGFSWQKNANLQWQSGLIVNIYREGKAWNYFGDYNAVFGTTGFSYAFDRYLIEFYSKFGHRFGSNGTRQKDMIELSFRINQFL